MQPALFGDGARFVGAVRERSDPAVRADQDGRDGERGGDGGEYRQSARGGGVAGGEDKQEGDRKQRGQQPIHVRTSSVANNDTAFLRCISVAQRAEALRQHQEGRKLGKRYGCAQIIDRQIAPTLCSPRVSAADSRRLNAATITAADAPTAVSDQMLLRAAMATSVGVG